VTHTHTNTQGFQYLGERVCKSWHVPAPLAVPQAFFAEIIRKSGGYSRNKSAKKAYSTVSHTTYVTSLWVMSHVNESCRISFSDEWVMWHVWMSHVTHMKTRHFAHVDGLYHISMSHVISITRIMHVNLSRHISMSHEWVTSRSNWVWQDMGLFKQDFSTQSPGNNSEKVSALHIVLYEMTTELSFEKLYIHIHQK